MSQSDILALNELKMLTIDMINHAQGGSPGIALDMAPVMYSLFTRVLNVYPKNPGFFNRDRVILSASHLAPLYYAILHMTGFEITKENLMNYRRGGFLTPSLPEMENPLGVDITTGVAGDGVATAVGISLGQRYMNALIQSEDNRVHLLNFTTYCFLSDADMMSGTSEEAFSFAAAQGLSDLVFIYDANDMTMDGSTVGVLEEDTAKRFLSKGFYVDTLKDNVTIKDITRALEAAKKSSKPAILIFKNKIGKDTFNEGKSILHAGVLSVDDTNSLRRKYNLFLPPFEISKDSFIHIEKMIDERMKRVTEKWNIHYTRVKSINNANLNNILTALETGKSTISFDTASYKINDGYRESLIETNYKIMNLIAPKSNLFIGGSAGLTYTCRTLIGGSDFMSKTNPKGRMIRFGTRERAMAYILNGMSTLGLMVFGSTNLCFANEMKAGIRASALMNLPVTYIFTHDSLYNSDEGTIRIPIEELTMLRSIPNFTLYRPADIIELMGCWENNLQSKKPSAMIISKNTIPKLPGSKSEEVKKGAYIIRNEVSKLDGIIIATGSEVVSAMQIAFDLYKKGLDLRVVSMPSMELFLSEGKEYYQSILPDQVKIAVIEAGAKSMWYRFTKEEYILGIDDFPPSGLSIEVLQQMNFDYDSLKLKIETIMR